MAEYRWLVQSGDPGAPRPAEDVVPAGLPDDQPVVRDEAAGCFVVYRDRAALAAAIAGGRRHLHEVVRAGQPQRMRLDVDIAPAAAAALGRTPDSLLEEILGVFLDELYAVYGGDRVGGLPDEVAVAESVPDDGGPPPKHSFHVVAVPFAFPGAAECRALAERVRARLPPGVRDLVDPGVYAALQNFRVLGCTKAGAPPRTKRLTGRFGTRTDFADPLASTLLVAPTERLLPARLAAPDAAPEALGDAALGEGDLAEVLAAVPPAVTAAHRLRCVRGSLVIFDRVAPSACALCGRAHARDNTLVLRVDGRAVWEMCRRCPGRSERVATLDPPADPADPAGEPRAGRVEALAAAIAAGALPAREPSAFLAGGDPAVVYDEPRMRPYPKVRTLAVRANMGIGKSEALRRYIADNFGPEDTILFVTFRRTFSSALMQSLARLPGRNFVLYSAVAGPLDQPDLVVQAESLPRVVIPPPPATPRSLVVFDEFGSILDQMCSPLHQDFAAAWAKFDWLTRTAEHVVCLDANLGTREREVLRVLRPGPVVYHENRHVRDPKRVFVTTDRAAFVATLVAAVGGGARVVVPTNSLRDAEAYHRLLTEMFPARRVVMYTSKTLNSVKDRHFGDVNRYWADVDVLILTPTCTAGVSYELEGFDLMCPSFTDRSCDVEACRQMMGRVRSIRTRAYVVHVAATRCRFPTDVRDLRLLLHDRRSVLYRDAAGHIARDLGVGALQFEYADDGAPRYYETKFFHVFLHTLATRLKSRNDFLARFMCQMAAEGGTVGPLADYLAAAEGLGLAPPTVADRNAAVCAVDAGALADARARNSGARRALDGERCAAISAAPDLTEDEATRLRAARRALEDVSSEQLVALSRYSLRQAYAAGIPAAAPMTARWVAAYDTPRARAVYRNLQRITARPTVRESLGAIRAAECDVFERATLVDPTAASVQRDLNRNYVYEQHEHAVLLLSAVGMRCIGDPAALTAEEVAAAAARYRERVNADAPRGAFVFGLSRPGRVPDPARGPGPVADAAVRMARAVLPAMYGVTVARGRDGRYRLAPTRVGRQFAGLPWPPDPGAPEPVPAVASALAPLPGPAAPE